MLSSWLDKALPYLKDQSQPLRWVCREGYLGLYIFIAKPEEVLRYKITFPRLVVGLLANTVVPFLIAYSYNKSFYLSYILKKSSKGHVFIFWCTHYFPCYLSFYLFIYSFIHSFIHSCMHALVRQQWELVSIESAWNRQLIQTPIGSFSDAPSLSLSTVGIHLGKQAPLLEC